MSANDNKKYYWLKLKKDFFQQHQIRILKGLPNGKDYLIFYLQLMTESTSHEGKLRFSDNIPYSAEMLSVLTDTNIDVVKNAVDILTQLELIEILDDATIYMSEVEKLIGSETGQTIRKNKAKETKRLERGNGGVNFTLENRVKSIDNNNAQMCASKVSDNQIEMFNQFWEAYPKKKDRARAIKVFNKKCKNQETLDQILKAIEIQKLSDQWTKEKGQFIPYPTTFLNGERWNDEVDVEIESSKSIDLSYKLKELNVNE